MSFGIGFGDIIKLCELAGRVYKNCRDCPGEYKTLTVQTRSLTNLLSDIQDKFEKIPESKQQQLFDAYVPCIEVLDELDRLLLHYNGLDTKSKRAWDRLKFDPNDLRNLRERLVASVAMLNTFWTSLIHDVQVLILEALERLERDYSGGHREESIASIERLTSGGQEDDNENDEAWHQIIRDLEDVGISQQQALSYREYIVDWLITAVNEGRLLEERPPEAVTDFSISEGIGTALAEIELGESFSGRDIPTIVSLTEVSPPSRPPPPVPRPPIPRPPIPDSHPSTTASVASQGNSVRSLPNLQQDVDLNHASLYADPERSPIPTPSVRSNVSGVPHVPVSHTSNIPQSSFEGPSNIPSPQTPSVPILPLDTDAPPSYFEEGTAMVIDMEWTARQAVAAWYRKDFVAAEKHLEDQLAAVERGQRCTSSDGQPDRRVLKHLLGACASLTGKFPKAKKLFENVFHGSFVNLQSLDEGDIAAARWLGDLCLHTQEHANAMLAYSVAYEGSIARFGTKSQDTRQVAMEIMLLDHWLSVFKRIEGTLSLNQDPTNILSSAEIVEKNRLLMDVKKSVYDIYGSTSNIPNPLRWGRPTYDISPRPRYETRLSEGFLLNPLISLSKWPLAYDPFFSPSDAVQLDHYMNTVQLTRNFKPLLDRQIPKASLGDSKKLHYLTKRGSRWLINAVEKGLEEMGIASAENCFEPSITCCLNQQREGVSYTEGVEIYFSKLAWREVYGIKVSDVRWATRKVGPGGSNYMAQKYRSTDNFRDLVKGILERAEAEEDGQPKPAFDTHLGGSYEYLQASNASPYEKRNVYS